MFDNVKLPNNELFVFMQNIAIQYIKTVVLFDFSLRNGNIKKLPIFESEKTVVIALHPCFHSSYRKQNR